MPGEKAIVRQHVERIDGVSRTWIEWETVEYSMVRTLVVEVEFPTDANENGHRPNVLDAVLDTAKQVLENETTMVISRLRIVPKGGC